MLVTGRTSAVLVLILIGYLQDISCQCPENKFGSQCNLDCRCAAGEVCNADGQCSECDIYWSGPTCQVALVNKALNKHASHSSDGPDMVDKNGAELAVDGDDSTYSWIQNQNETGQVWWRLELAEVTRISAIRVKFYNPDPEDTSVEKRRPGFIVAVSNSTDDRTEVICYHDHSDTPPSPIFVLKNCTSPAMYVKIYNSRSLSDPESWSKFPNLVISEVEILSDKGCSDGTFGEQCEKECGYCKEVKCQRADGTCADCLTGHFGKQCDHTCPEMCKANVCLKSGQCINCRLESFYGIYCNISCSGTCQGGCFEGNGTCRACIDKYYGDKCESSCNYCKTACLRNGTCNVDGCSSGFYGNLCDKKCSSSCVNGAGCDRQTGKCGQCDNNRYGDFCQHSCNTNCKNSECYRNGTCRNGCHDNSFHGDTCDVRCGSSITDCLLCEDFRSPVMCLNCHNGKYGDLCEKACPANCDKCLNDTECTQCMLGFSGAKCTDKCEIPNCRRCDMSDSCQSCVDGYFGSKCEGRCSQGCKSCETDPVTPAKSVCKECLKGKFLFEKYCLNCTVGCAACKSFANCTECDPGKYGTQCSDRCPSNCYECLGLNNCTKCKDGWSGELCSCSHNCTRDGPVSEWCDASGKCLKGCVKGKMGEHCNIDCPRKGYCLACEQNAGQCTECVNGTYGRISHCEKNCGMCQQDSFGIVTCDIETGECIGQCVNGYHGKYCNQSCSDRCFDPITKSQKCDKFLATCSSCRTGFYGSTCEKSCNSNCLDPDTNTNKCDQQTGICQKCKQGHWGERCEEECHTHCYSSRGANTCNKDSGMCNGCLTNYFGTICDQLCPEHCDRECEQRSGICEMCKSNHYGEYCNLTCPANCAKDIVGGKVICNRQSGECLFCKAGVYGDNCRNKCPSFCRRSPVMGNYPQCHKADGSCPNCEDGYYGKFCEQACNDNCGKMEGNKGSGSCNQTTGACEQGCKPGFYGDVCNKMCNTTCRGLECNMKTAECLHGCEYGYDGIYCEKEMPSDYSWIIILVIVLVTVTVVLVVGGFLLKRYRNKKSQSAKKPQMANGRPEERNPLISNGSSIPLQATSRNRRRDVEGLDEDDPAVGALIGKTKPSDYYDPSTRIIVSAFPEYLQGRKREDPDWYKKDFEKLPKGLLKPCSDAMSFANRGRCRYKQLYPYDDNRIHLEPEGEDKHDFINASYLNGYKKPKAFIAAQGPTDVTINDFWRMIFQQDCGKIVMLTNLFEECKMKCVRYWPEADEPQTYGIYEVTLVSENELPNWTIRHLQATHGETKEVKDFQHFHFTAWPDRGVPDNPSIMLNFRDKVMHEHSFLDGPILVHCSAGIGRTGTFVALDFLLRQAHAEAYIDVFNTVTDMRYQRTNFVQTDIQYEFVHNAIVEALNTKECEVTQEQFNQYYSSLMEFAGDDTEETKLQEQFRMVDEMAPEFDADCFAASTCEENLHKNRYPDIMPLDLNRAYLSTPVKGSNDYINAVFVPTCSNKTGFIITQMPLPHTVTDFWRLVFDHHVSNIVMMNNANDDDESVGEYWPSDDCTYGPFRVELLSIDNCEDFSLLNIQLTYSSLSRQSKMIVRLFQYHGWPENQALPTNTVSLTSLISQVSRSSRDSRTEPIIVHCMDGAERSGLFCAVAAVLDRLQMDKKINIPQTVLQLRTRRPQLVHSFEQFDFVYRAVLEHLESTQIYSNVL